MTFADLFKTIAFGIPIGLAIVDVFGYIARVDGVSMRPALNPDDSSDYVLLNRLALRLSDVSRGEVVALYSPKNRDQKLIKRVIGLEGDVIRTLSYKSHLVTVPEGHCWVEGDNASNSMDSNLFGPVALGLVTAKATLVVWPPHRWQWVKCFVPQSRTPVNLEQSRRTG